MQNGYHLYVLNLRWFQICNSYIQEYLWVPLIDGKNGDITMVKWGTIKDVPRKTG